MRSTHGVAATFGRAAQANFERRRRRTVAKVDESILVADIRTILGLSEAGAFALVSAGLPGAAVAPTGGAMNRDERLHYLMSQKGGESAPFVPDGDLKAPLVGIETPRARRALRTS